MTHTFILHVVEPEGKVVYQEYHNFKELEDSSFIYYRGGATHPLEINISKSAAIEAMNNLSKSGWTTTNSKIVTI